MSSLVENLQESYSEYYENNNFDGNDSRFPYELKRFQANSKHIIENDGNVVVTAHTGCGKTTVAIIGIYNSIKKGLKVAFTTPIKSLSNQTYNGLIQLNEKFNSYTGRDIKIGLLTGDSKINSDNADIIVMTTEILKNSLNNIEKKDEEKKDKELQKNFIEKLGCWINDEAHYMGCDKDRGPVWEKTYILISKLQNNVQLIALSATINDKIKFSNWIGRITKKKNYIVSTNKRIIPLKHYLFMDDKIHIFLDENKKFNEDNYKMFLKYKINKSPQYLLNQCVTFLKEKNLLQSIFFCYSRKKCEQYAKYLELTLVDNEERSKIDHIINDKLSSRKEILNVLKQKTSRGLSILELIYKGICFHHSGLLPVVKEIIEILFKNGLIKVLFATETFAVGINMPTRTVIFTGLKKPSKEGFRYLESHEYKQQAGRSGRLGIDKVGIAIILKLNNYLPNENEIKRIVSGKNQNFESKLSLDYDTFIKIGINENCNITNFLNTSFYEVDTKNYILKKNDYLKEEINYLKQLKLKKPYKESEEDLLDKYTSLLNNKTISTNQRNKKIKKLNINKINKFDDKLKYYNKIYDQQNEIKRIEGDIYYQKNWIDLESSYIIQFLKDNEYIKKDVNDVTKVNIDCFLIKGVMASQINDCNSLLLTEIITNNILNDITPEEILGVLSIFIQKREKNETELYQIRNIKIQDKIKKIGLILNNFNEKERSINYYMYNSNEEFWKIYLGNVDMIYELACKESIESCSLKYELYVGDIIKTMSRIYDICMNIIYVCKIYGDLTIIPKIELACDLINVNKWNDSLYIR
jgi:superfamily II RNA helicase